MEASLPDPGCPCFTVQIPKQHGCFLPKVTDLCPFRTVLSHRGVVSLVTKGKTLPALCPRTPGLPVCLTLPFENHTDSQQKGLPLLPSRLPSSVPLARAGARPGQPRVWSAAPREPLLSQGEITSTRRAASALVERPGAVVGACWRVSLYSTWSCGLDAITSLLQ